MVGLGKREYKPNERTIEQMDIALDPRRRLPTVVVYEWSVGDDGTTAEVKLARQPDQRTAELIESPWHGPNGPGPSR